MAIGDNEQVTIGSTQTKLRFVACDVRPKTFHQGSGTISKLSPLTFIPANEAAGGWAVWSGKTNDIYTLSSTGTVSGGTRTLTINGETTAAIAHSANAATIQAAIEALGSIDIGDVTVTGGPLSTNTDVVVTFTTTGKYAHKAVTLTLTSGVTGGGAETLAHTQTGVTTEGLKGFAFEDIVLDATNQTIGQVIMEGEIHYGDIPLPAGETQSVLDHVLRVEARPLGITIGSLARVR